MASEAPVVSVHSTTSSKKKNKKKKSKAAKDETNGLSDEPTRTNGHDEGSQHDNSQDEHGDTDEHVDTPVGTEAYQPDETLTMPDGTEGKMMVSEQATEQVNNVVDGSPTKTHVDEVPPKDIAANSHLSSLLSDTESRLAVAAKERDDLMAEVTKVRKSLESIQQRHEEELVAKQAALEKTQSGKEHAEGQYKNLLGKVNTIKAQLGERLKADAAELAQARSQIEHLEEQNRLVNDENQTLQSRVSELTQDLSEETQRHSETISSREADIRRKDDEINTLRIRSNLSQQNWAKERDDLARREAQAREEFDAARQAMQDWEILAMDERATRESLAERLVDMEEQLSSQREAYERAAAERDDQAGTVHGLQRTLQDIQEARKQELRELVETSQTQTDALRAQFGTATDAAQKAQTALDAAQAELGRALPFEKEVKEKNLLIGKLRHEAVILNDHLTKALRFLKKGKPEDNVDRQLVTNHLLHFLALDRSDAKKFQILQLISALLGWTDEQNEAAGLARPGAPTAPLTSPAASSLRFMPFRRASAAPSNHSTAAAAAAAASSSIPGTPELRPEALAGTSKDSLAELWSDFLEREAHEGRSPGTGSRSRPASGAGPGAGGAQAQVHVQRSRERVVSPTVER